MNTVSFYNAVYFFYSIENRYVTEIDTLLS